MVQYREIEGNLIDLALKGEFDVITHGCNCFCTMGAGLAPQMSKHFNANSFLLEQKEFRGDINKLGNIDFKRMIVLENGTGVVSYSPNFKGVDLTVVNSYTQYNVASTDNSTPLDYQALQLCLKKINKTFSGLKIGLPQIGCGLAGGDWEIVKSLIIKELVDCRVTVVIFKPNV